MVSAQSIVPSLQTLPPCMIQTPVETMEGAKVYWHFQAQKAKPVQKIPAVVVKPMATRVRIQFQLWEAGKWVLHTRSISATSLTARDERIPRLDENQDDQVRLSHF